MSPWQDLAIDAVTNAVDEWARGGGSSYEGLQAVVESALRSVSPWQAIATADPDVPVLLWTPPDRLHTKEQMIAFPDLGGHLHVAKPREWTWATHWMPLPDPPPPPSEAG